MAEEAYQQRDITAEVEQAGELVAKIAAELGRLIVGQT